MSFKSALGTVLRVRSVLGERRRESPLVVRYVASWTASRSSWSATSVLGKVAKNAV